MPHWIWQHPAWPHFVWQAETLAPLLRQAAIAQGRLLGRTRAGDQTLQAEFSLDTLLQNIVNSSAIEGERLNVESVRSSLARRLGLDANTAPPEARSEGLARIMWDATTNLETPLTEARLLQWHSWLFAGDDGFLGQKIRIGDWRGNEPMQVVSGRIDRPTVHFEAPPRDGLEARMSEFVAWFNASRSDARLDPLLRAAIAHFWLVTLHPFDDGNGRITRALTDLALAQGEPQSIRFYAMSVHILADRKGYYQQLENGQKLASTAPRRKSPWGIAFAEPLDLTPWLHWFLDTLQQAIADAEAQIDRVLDKSQFWLQHRQHGLGPQQIKVLNRLLDGDQAERGGFTQGISAAQYQAVAKVSKATATRHLADLVAKGCLVKLPGGGRNTRYQILQPADRTWHPRGADLRAGCRTPERLLRTRPVADRGPGSNAGRRLVGPLEKQPGAGRTPPAIGAQRPLRPPDRWHAVARSRPLYGPRKDRSARPELPLGTRPDHARRVRKAARRRLNGLNATVSRKNGANSAYFAKQLRRTATRTPPSAPRHFPAPIHPPAASAGRQKHRSDDLAAPVCKQYRPNPSTSGPWFPAPRCAPRHPVSYRRKQNPDTPCDASSRASRIASLPRCCATSARLPGYPGRPHTPFHNCSDPASARLAPAGSFPPGANRRARAASPGLTKANHDSPAVRNRAHRHARRIRCAHRRSIA